MERDFMQLLQFSRSLVEHFVLAFLRRQLEEFEVVLSHHDERLGARLNQLYLQEEWHFTKEKHSSKKMPKDIPPVDAEIRKRQVGGKFLCLHN